MNEAEALKILADPAGHTPAEVAAAELAVVHRTDNAATPADGPQPPNLVGDA